MMDKLFRCFGAPAAANPAAAPLAHGPPQKVVRPQARDGLDAPPAGVDPAASQVAPSPPRRAAQGRAATGAPNSRRLLKALRNFHRTPQTIRWCEITPRENDFYTWDTQFFFTTGRMADSLRAMGLQCVELEVIFPKSYPSGAPAVRVVSPNIRLNGAGVYGGAMCLDFLHRWDATIHEETLLATIHAAVANGEVRSKERFSWKEYTAGVEYIRKVHASWVRDRP